MTLVALILATAILAALGVILETICTLVPGWLIIETNDLDVYAALWYVVLCEREFDVDVNVTTAKKCEKLLYRHLFDQKSASTTANLSTTYESQVGTQVQVTSCWLMALGAFVLAVLQWRTFQAYCTTQTAMQEGVTSGTCTARAKFLYAGGFAAIFNILSGVLLSLVIFDSSRKYLGLETPRPPVPYLLFVAGAAVVCSLLSSTAGAYVICRVRKSVFVQRHNIQADDMFENGAQQTVPLSDSQDEGQSHQHKDNNFETKHSTVDRGEYMFGLEYSNERPPLMYRTQGTRKTDRPIHPFPGYKLAKQNLKGHDRKWWSKVTFASGPYY